MNKSIQYTANPIHYESKDRTPTSDRVCTNLTVCEFPYKFQADLPTHTTDRVCQDVTDCEADKDPECYYETDQEPSKTFVLANTRVHFCLDTKKEEDRNKNYWTNSESTRELANGWD